MFLTKLKMTASVLLAVSLIAAGAITRRSLAQASQPAPATAPPMAKAANDFASIDQRIHDWQPTREERRMDEIGWAKDLRQAMRLAREHKRPVFLFTYSGEATEANAIALRRC